MTRIAGAGGPGYTPFAQETPADPAMPTVPAQPGEPAPAVVSSGSIPVSPDAQRMRDELLARTAAAQTPKSASPDDAYWAAQPPEVQKLRYMQPEDREKAAGELIAKGFKIDVPVMVWGWGASTTNSLRAAYGYTWVPSALQEPVLLAPGLSMPGNLKPYDPNNPPPGSIPVDTTNVDPGIMMKDLTPDQIRSMHQDLDTPATVNAGGGATVPMLAQLLTSKEQALSLQRTLQNLGFGSLDIAEQQPAAGATTNWNGETRRPYAIGGLNAGLILDILDKHSGQHAVDLIRQSLRSIQTNQV